MAKPKTKKPRSKDKPAQRATDTAAPQLNAAQPIQAQQRASAAAPTQQTTGAPAAEAGAAPVNGYYIRLEGLNIDAGVLDTDQLSTVRGAGLLLRRAALDAAKVVAAHPAGKAVSTGASIGEFRLSAADPAAADALVSQLRTLLAEGDFAQLSFAVAAEPTYRERPPSDVQERALARIRFAQMRMPTLVPPPTNTAANVGACGWEGRRPADAPKRIPRYKPDGTLEQEIAVCRSVYDRYRYGLHQKHRFYNDETGRQDDEGSYTNDLADLAYLPAARNLDGKVAVIYADGNRFSAIRGKCNGFADLERFDKQVRGHRRAFLDRLLARIAADPAFNTKHGKRRIETLLWGGDELILVVPAWRGVQVLQHLFAATANAQFLPEPKNKKDKQRQTPWRLTHAAGIVFCRARTPIKRAQALARQLANGVKAQLKAAATGTTPDQLLRSTLHNAWDYAVLESVDFPTEDELSDYFAHRYHSVANRRSFLTPFADWCDDNGADRERRHAAKLLADLSKGQVYAVARAAIAPTADWRDAGTLQGFRHAHARMREVIRPKKTFESHDAMLQKLFGGRDDLDVPGADAPIPDPWPWIHLAELWDYLAPEPAERQGDTP
jgi:hypothetical protein